MLIAALLVALACLLWPPRGREPRTEVACEPVRPMAGTGWELCRDALVTLRRRRERHPWVADFAEVAAVGLDAGLDLGSAALVSARSPGVVARAPWLRDHLTASLEGGRGVATILEVETLLTAEERQDLGVLVSAWRLAEDVGAATAAVTAAAAISIRGRHAAAERTAVVAAGPRASMWLLSALPVAGPLAAAFVGIGPARLYSSGPARLLAATGLLLTAAGWWWARSLLRRAQRAGRTDGSVA